MLKSKQIESLVADKIVTNDEKMFISKIQLDKISDFKVEKYDNKADLPSVGNDESIYIVINDESNNGKSCIYIYKNNGYEMISGDGSSNNSSNANTSVYVKDFVESDWIDVAGDKVISIASDEHNQKTDSIVVFVFDVDTNVIVPYDIDSNKDVKIYSKTPFDGKVIVSDFISHSHGNIEVLSKFSENNGTLLFDGSPIKGNGSVNPLTTSPLEYGYFGSTSEQNNSLTTGSTLILDLVRDGNMELNNNSVRLKKSKTYNIEYAILPQFASNQGQFQVGVFNSENGDQISIAVIDSIPVGGTLNRNGQSYDSFIYTPTEDIDIELKILSNTSNNVLKLYPTFTMLKINEIRNNPVNQYGGFETEILFDGIANKIEEYVLSDDFSNYDYILVEGAVTHENDEYTHRISTLVNCSSINQNPVSQHQYPLYFNLDVSYQINFNLVGNVLKIVHCKSTGIITNPKIYRVTGIRGQLPTKIIGGTF